MLCSALSADADFVYQAFQIHSGLRIQANNKQKRKKKKPKQTRIDKRYMQISRSLSVLKKDSIFWCTEKFRIVENTPFA